MAHLFALVVTQHAALVGCAYLQQSAANTLRISGKLHRRRIRQIFPIAVVPEA